MIHEISEDISLLILSGSTQSDSQSLKVSQSISHRLSGQSVKHHLVNLHDLNLPSFGVKTNDDWQSRWQPAQDICRQVDGVVIVSPEYNGGPSPAILNFMLYVGDELKHKPVLLAGVSAGRGGTYPIAALRQLGCKDPGYVVIPESVIVSQVGSVLNDQSLEITDSLTDDDKEVRQRCQTCLDSLLAYARALRSLRAPKD